MPRKGTKAAEIMRLWKHGIFTTSEIAHLVGCRDSYVRVVARQRRGTGQCEADKRWRAKTFCGDRTHARLAATEAYRRARRNGKSTREAQRAYAIVWQKTMIEAAHA